MDYNNFYKQLDQVILNTGFLHYTTCDAQMHLTLLKQTSFSLYDMNADGAVCEYDLFSIIRHTDNKMFAKAITQDIRDIQLCMDKKFN